MILGITSPLLMHAINWHCRSSNTNDNHMDFLTSKNLQPPPPQPKPQKEKGKKLYLGWAGQIQQAAAAQQQLDDSAHEQRNPQQAQEKQSHYRIPWQQAFWLTSDQIQLLDIASDGGTWKEWITISVKNITYQVNQQSNAKQKLLTNPAACHKRHCGRKAR